MDEKSDIIGKIFSSVSDIFGVSIEDIRSKSRIREVADARKAVVYILTKDMKKNPGQISKMVNKNHCTMSYMLRNAETLMGHNAEFKIKIDRTRAATGLDSSLCPCCGRPYDR